MPSNKITFGCGHLLFADKQSSNLNARNSRQSSISSYKSPVK